MQARFHCMMHNHQENQQILPIRPAQEHDRKMLFSLVFSVQFTPSFVAENQDEIADLCLFLCSDRAANITGSSYSIDGGLMAVLPERS
jgi:NAD(P)-dependent dehydrogenase (short-subunit alcohol dehydrogenase family)